MNVKESELLYWSQNMIDFNVKMHDEKLLLEKDGLRVILMI